MAPEKHPAMWIPEHDPHVLAVVGKLGEEAAELCAICCRIVIQGMDGIQPETGKLNFVALMEEMADVKAMLQATAERVGINPIKINERATQKYKFKQPWFDFLKHLPRV